jgi:hypothetical protein
MSLLTDSPSKTRLQSFVAQLLITQRLYICSSTRRLLGHAFGVHSTVCLSLGSASESEAWALGLGHRCDLHPHLSYYRPHHHQVPGEWNTPLLAVQQVCLIKRLTRLNRTGHGWRHRTSAGDGTSAVAFALDRLSTLLTELPLPM